MCDSRLTKQFLFGWLRQCRPPHGVKLRRGDRVRKDLKHFNISKSDWYVKIRINGVSCVCLPHHCWNWYGCGCFVKIVTDLLGNLRKWRGTGVIARQTAAKRINSGIMCSICGRTFRRRQDLSRHKCLPTVNDGINLFSRAGRRHLPR